MAAHLLLSAALPVLIAPLHPTQQLFPQAQQAPSVALAVQRLAFSDASRCLDDLCYCEARGLSGRLEERFEKMQTWVTSRELLVRWAVSRWAEHHVRTIKLPPLLTLLLRPPAGQLTLTKALAPVQPWRLTRAGLRASPAKTLAILWQFCLLWVSKCLLPADVAQARRRRQLAPTLMELATAYDALR